MPTRKAEVKFTAYDFAIYGGLEGKVEQIGADTVTDERQFVLRGAGPHRSQHRGDKNLPIIPGWWPRFTS